VSEAWLQILQKALAKVFGSYMRLENGQSGEIFQILTGAPSILFKSSDIFEKFPNMLCSCIPKKLKGKSLCS
jgi:hypothetical protein